MALQTLATLKAYFNTGDQPTESNFSDLLDSTVQTVTSGIVTLDTDTSTAIPALAIPGSSLIMTYFIVATTAITAGSATKIGHKIGTSADGEQLSAADDNSLTNSTTSLTAGLGTASLTDGFSTSLSAQAAIVPVAGTIYRAADTNVHFTITSNVSLTGGAVVCGVQYIKLT